MTEGDEQWHRWEDRIKSIALLLVGLGGAVNELFLRHGELRVTACAFIATLLGLPFVLEWQRTPTRQRKRQ